MANRVSNVANTYKGVGASKMHKVTITRLALTTKRKDERKFPNQFLFVFPTQNVGN